VALWYSWYTRFRNSNYGLQVLLWVVTNILKEHCSWFHLHILPRRWRQKDSFKILVVIYRTNQNIILNEKLSSYSCTTCAVSWGTQRCKTNSWYVTKVKCPCPHHEGVQECKCRSTVNIITGWSWVVNLITSHPHPSYHLNRLFDTDLKPCKGQALGAK
jgi:hypothetical protein